MSPPRTLAGAAPVSTGTWHSLRVNLGADRFEVTADGRVGIRPTADNATEFDQLREEEAR